MKTQKLNFQGGFAPFLIVAIVAILAIGGGVYVSNKNKQAKNAELEGNLDTQANVNADLNANENADLGISANINAKGSIRSLLALGKNSVCTFTTAKDGVETLGTVWVSVEGEMRGDFKTTSTATGTVNSSILVQDDYSYVWSGTQGAKMDISKLNASASATANQSVDIDAELDYECQSWVYDDSKFVVPTGVNFVDVDALLKANLPGGVTLPKPY